METTSVNTENSIISKMPQCRSRRVTVRIRDGNQFLYKVALVLVFKILQNNFGFGYGFQNF